jgi:hypothetical protein
MRQRVIRQRQGLRRDDVSALVRAQVPQVAPRTCRTGACGECLATADRPARVHFGVLRDLDCRAEARRLQFRRRLPGLALFDLSGSCCSARRSHLRCGQRRRVGSPNTVRISRRTNDHRCSLGFACRSRARRPDRWRSSPVACAYHVARRDYCRRGVFAAHDDRSQRGVARGDVVPGGALSGSVVPGDAVPGGALPGGALPGGALPDGANGRRVRSAEGRARRARGGGAAVLQPGRRR